MDSKKITVSYNEVKKTLDLIEVTSGEASQCICEGTLDERAEEGRRRWALYSECIQDGSALLAKVLQQEYGNNEIEIINARTTFTIKRFDPCSYDAEQDKYIGSYYEVRSFNEEYLNGKLLNPENVDEKICQLNAACRLYMNGKDIPSARGYFAFALNKVRNMVVEFINKRKDRDAELKESNNSD